MSSFSVFLSFSGEDARYTLHSHLVSALKNANIPCFQDEKISKGETILRQIEDGISRANVAVIVFSKRYASSSWCLDELEAIMRRRRARKMKVLPVFYHVDESDVLNQSGIYTEAFAKHKRDRGTVGRVPQWKDAMTQAARLAGISARHCRPESELVEEIVKNIRNRRAAAAKAAKDAAAAKAAKAAAVAYDAAAAKAAAAAKKATAAAKAAVAAKKAAAAAKAA